jgi:hypothetical protein
MEKKYFMGMNDKLVRSTTREYHDTYINSTLRIKLLKLSIDEAFNFYNTFFNFNNRDISLDDLVTEYNIEFKHARSLDLFKAGGIREKDHINLWCLGRVLSPELYIESGVYIGSSLHAFLNSPKLNRIIAIDPNLSNLKITKKDFSNVELIDKQDFSQLKIKNIPEKSLVYFDDHINTANRIIQANEKGIKYLLFDDSTGLEGICQRLYPPVPTIPMIMNWESFDLNDEINWTWYKVNKPDIKSKNLFLNLFRQKNRNIKNVSFTIDKEFLDQCKQARIFIKKCSRIPDLGIYIPQTFPERMVDTTKYLIELDI